MQLMHEVLLHAEQLDEQFVQTPFISDCPLLHFTVQFYNCPLHC